MKLFPLIFITAVICQADASTIFGKMFIGRPRRPSSFPDCTSPPCPIPSQQQTHRVSEDCLLCSWRPCSTCSAAQPQFLQQCPPCVSPPCPPCQNQDRVRFLSRQDARAPAATERPWAPTPRPEEPTTREPPSDDCTPSETGTATEELVHKVAPVLPTACLMRKSSLLPPFRPVDTACLLRGAGLLGFVRRHPRELMEYLQRHSLLTDGFPDRSSCPPALQGQPCSPLAETTQSPQGLHNNNNQEPATALLPQDSSDQRPATEILRR